jgi:hypothetical protein
MQEAYMWKLRIGALLTGGLLWLGMSTTASAASGGDPNAGDVWVDSFGQPAGPGHEMDPHLSCQTNINLWGAGLADAQGTFTIDGWPPSGSQEIDYSDSWTYEPGTSGDQVIAVIDVSKLIDQAEANGDSATAQGFHFKLDFSQDPQKHKTFWIDCTPSSSGGGGGNSDGGGNTTSGGNNAGGGNTPGDGSTTTTSTSPSTTRRVATLGAATAERRSHVARKHRHKHVRRHRIHASHVRIVRIHLPTFTG